MASMRKEGSLVGGPKIYITLVVDICLYSVLASGAWGDKKESI